ncbi:helix-turn-helix transcriptional regulator, partial [Variovorax sp. LT2P21]
LDLDDVSLARYPDLAPFLFQEYVDFAFDETDFARIRGWLDELHTLNAGRNFGAKIAMRGIVQQIIGLACMRQEQALMRLSLQHNGKTSQRDALQRVVRYVRDNLDKPLSLTDAAAAAFLSPNYLANLLRKETDRTFTDLVTERRIERAKELLSSTSLLVREIAHQCGFTDEAYFNRRFRQWVGTTPRNFRRDHVVGTRG